MRPRPKAARTLTAIGGAGLAGLAMLAAPAFAFEEAPPRERPAAPEAAAPETPPAPNDEGDDAKNAVDAVTERVQELADRIGKQAEPVTDEIRKTVGDAFSTLADALKTDDASSDDVASALERARDQVLNALQEGGSINKSAREALRKARDEVRDDLEKSRDQAGDALRRRYKAETQRLGEKVDDARAKARAAADDLADSTEEVERKIEKAFRDDPAVADLYKLRDDLQDRLAKASETARSKTDPVLKELKARLDETKAEIAARWKESYDDLRDKALGEAEAEGSDPDVSQADGRVRDLQRQLRDAQRALQDARGRRRGDRKIAPLRGRVGPVRIGPDRDAERSDSKTDDRIDALESKMDRVLKALEGLTTDKPKDQAESDDE